MPSYVDELLSEESLRKTGYFEPAAVAYWRTLVTDDDAVFDKEIELDASAVTPFVTWGTNPGQGVPLSANVALSSASDSNWGGADGCSSHRRSAVRPLGVIEYTVRRRCPFASVLALARPRATICMAS